MMDEIPTNIPLFTPKMEKRYCPMLVRDKNGKTRKCGKPLPQGYRFMCPTCQKRLDKSYDLDVLIAAGG